MNQLVKDRIALGIKQPWAELILRGVKTLEVRSQKTNVRGIIYIYTSKKPATSVEANQMVTVHNLEIDTLPMGQIVGTVQLVDVSPAKTKHAQEACLPKVFFQKNDCYVWHLANPVTYAEPVKPRFLPYGVWFYPFQRKG